MINWSDFEKVEIRLGTVVQVDEFPKARKPAYKLVIDFGPLGIRKTSAQITTLYKPQDILGKQVAAVVNFPPKQIADFMSNCLVLGAVGENGEVTLLTGMGLADNGLRIS
ncbi:MAG: tRNA-binding protein [Owenweeksia sp.]